FAARLVCETVRRRCRAGWLLRSARRRDVGCGGGYLVARVAWRGCADRAVRRPPRLGVASCTSGSNEPACRTGRAQEAGSAVGRSPSIVTVLCPLKCMVTSYRFTPADATRARPPGGHPRASVGLPPAEPDARTRRRARWDQDGRSRPASSSSGICGRLRLLNV